MKIYSRAALAALFQCNIRPAKIIISIRQQNMTELFASRDLHTEKHTQQMRGDFADQNKTRAHYFNTRQPRQVCKHTYVIQTVMGCFSQHFSLRRSTNVLRCAARQGFSRDTSCWGWGVSVNFSLWASPQVPRLGFVADTWGISRCLYHARLWRNGALWWWTLHDTASTAINTVDSLYRGHPCVHGILSTVDRVSTLSRVMNIYELGYFTFLKVRGKGNLEKPVFERLSSITNSFKKF